ncbi:MAG: glycosyltransferase [Candidatus Peribacteraceae bacterium]|nr:glycosyltransferase [Candidatus Peribacteraceae bacterium]
MPRLRLVYLSAFLSPFRSGAEAMVEEVSVRLVDQFDVTIVTARLKRSSARHDHLQKVRVIRVGFGLPIDKYLFPILAPIRCLFLRPHIIHAVLESYAGLALVGCRFTVPWAKRVLTLQSTNTSFLLGPIHRSAGVITAISNALVERARQFGRDDVVLIPNGIDLQLIQKACATHPKDSGCVLFVGRLEPMKGVDVLLNAFAKAIVGLSPDIHLRIVGDGSQSATLKNLAKELEIDHRVTFTGRVNHQAVLEEFARAEIFCGLSRSEALGNVFLEAQASGCAVIATNVGGIPDIVKDRESGLLVPPDDVDASADAIKSLLSDPSLRAKLSLSGKKGIERYDWDAVTAMFLIEIYNRI